ncbi:MAG TPA: hypothetical protein VFU68_02015, partial [Terracidiphilus sp.]|nr:hypothetical protein [Terracidiphilus sp.]
MSRTFPLAISALCFGLACSAVAQQNPQQNPQQNTDKPSPYNYGEQPSGQPTAPAPPEDYAPPQLSPVPLEWTPPALEALNSQAAVKTSFSLDR